MSARQGNGGQHRIAIVGLGCVLPGAASAEAFWARALERAPAFAPLEGGSWEWERLGLPPTRAALVSGFAPDWKAFRIPPADAAAMNPMQLQVLEAGRAALSGLKVLPAASTGVWLGATGLGWRPDTAARVRMDELEAAIRDEAPTPAVVAAVAAARARFEAALLPASEEPVVNSTASIAAGRIGMLLDLRGPHAAVDAGFASGLAALDLAARLLRDGTVDCALAGGASELLSPAEVAAMRAMGVLADGEVRPFDAEAGGTLPGEGVVLFALKRLEDALRDGEQVHAVLLGLGASSDGAAGSLIAQRSDGAAEAARRALAAAGVAPGSVGFVECHATGTPKGDAAEVRGLAEVYGAAGRPVALGSAKPLVGHLRGASGAVGVLRAVLALRHGVVPPQAGFLRPHPDLGLDGTPFVVPTAPHPLRGESGAPPRAAVSALSLGGLAWHAVLEAPPAPGRAEAPARPRRAPEPLAVVGLGGIFPGAPDVPRFWEGLLDGRDAIGEIPPDRWDAARYCDPDPSRLERSYTRLGALAAPLERTPAAWRIPPAVQPAVDPAHLLALAAAEEAVEDAGLAQGEWDRGRAGVFLGFMACQGRKQLAEVRFHLARLGSRVREALLAQGLDRAGVDALLARAARRLEAGLPPLGEDALTGWLGSVAAARIARRFGLRGPQLAIESACASTLAAVQAAAASLRDGTCDTALAGGLWADMQPEFYVGSCRFNALSATGSTPFDARASGFVPGEGAGLLVLRRLADAERDGQRIHAVLRAVAGSSDGKGKSVFAPSATGEALAMRRALAEAGVDPRTVGYVECHGTGTALGDRAEVEACSAVYGAGRAEPLLLGSVKSNVGHLLAAAGAPALVKAVLAVRDGKLPPSLHVERQNPAIDAAAGQVEVVTRARAWDAGSGPRRAGVSGFGLGGTNLHCLVEEYRPGARIEASAPAGPAPAARTRTLPIVAAGGASEDDCLAAIGRLAVRLRDATGEAYLDAVRESWATARDAPVRAAVVARDGETLSAKAGLLGQALSGAFDPAVLTRQGVFLGRAGGAAAATFPGQGPQYPNMLRDAIAAFPELGASLDAADAAYLRLAGRTLRAAFFTDRPEGWAQRDEDAHCAVFAVNVALFELLRGYGFAPRALVGQSAGELAALVAAGAMRFEDGLALVRERTLSVLALTGEDPGRMVALACGAERAAGLLRGLAGYAALAADNGPGACIVSGDARAVPELLRRAAGEGIEASVLAVSHGYHSALIAAARPRYLAALRRVAFRRPAIEIVSTVTGGSLAGLDLARLPDHLADQFVEPVRLRQAIEAAWGAGIRTFVECGPKWPLTTFTSEILAGRPHHAQATIHPKVGEVEQLHRALACLFVQGQGLLEAQGEPQMKPASFEERVPELGNAGTPAVSGAAGGAEALRELLRGMRDLIDRYLGAAPAAADRTEAAPALPGAWPAAASARPAAPPPAPTAPPPDAAQIRGLLLAEYTRRTGYPEEMLGPDLDLEAELGIDTVKQVAVLAAVRERLGLPPDPTFKLREARTIAKACAWLERRLGAGPGPTPLATAEPAAAPREPVRDPVPAPTRERASPEAEPGPGAGRAAAPPEATPRGAMPLEAARAAVGRALLDELVRRTGYPEEMLGLDLDLEAELGIDTVRQVAALAAVRERFGLLPDPSFRLRDARTLRKAIEILAGRVAATSGPPEPEGPRPPDGPRPPGGGLPAPTRSPAPEIPRNGGHGVAAPVPAPRRLLEAALAALPDGAPVVLEALTISRGPEEHGPGEPLVDVLPGEAGADALRLKVVWGADRAEVVALRGGEREPQPDVHEVQRAIAPERRARASSGAELREALAPILGRAEGLVEWARSDGFMVAVGGATVPAGAEPHRLAAVLAAAGEVAGFAWLGLTGSPHAVCAIERVTLDAVPPAGAELGVHARMVAPDGGLWRADVTVVCGGERVALIRGLTGTPAARADAAAGSIDEAAQRAWRRFSRRLRGGAAGEDAA